MTTDSTFGEARTWNSLLRSVILIQLYLLILDDLPFLSLDVDVWRHTGNHSLQSRRSHFPQTLAVQVAQRRQRPQAQQCQIGRGLVGRVLGVLLPTYRSWSGMFVSSSSLAGLWREPADCVLSLVLLNFYNDREITETCLAGKTFESSWVASPLNGTLTTSSRSCSSPVMQSHPAR